MIIFITSTEPNLIPDILNKIFNIIEPKKTTSNQMNFLETLAERRKFSTTSNRNSNFKDKIMVKYTNKDYENMIQCYKACDHNSVKASAMYRKLYPNCGSPSPRTILLAMNRQRTTGNVTVVREYVETPSKVREQRIEKVLAAYESSDNISGNEIAKQVGVPKSTTHTILKKKKDSKKLRENEGDGCLIDLQREGSSHHNSRIQRNADSETVDLDDPTWMPET